jgi:hypothetical protein
MPPNIDSEPDPSRNAAMSPPNTWWILSPTTFSASPLPPNRASPIFGVPGELFGS